MDKHCIEILILDNFLTLYLLIELMNFNCQFSYFFKKKPGNYIEKSLVLSRLKLSF